MKTWKNTATLDGYIDDLVTLVPPDEAELAVIGGKPIDLNAMPQLRGILKCGVGRDNLPEAEAKERGIALRIASPSTAETIYEETASYACRLILELAYRNVGDLEQWRKHDRPSLASRRLLILGLGNIGRKVQSKMSNFMEVDTFDALENSADELESKIRAADIITLHVPLIEKTRGMFDQEKLAMMKTGAGLVNTSRGPVVDEAALEVEIANGRIAAAFDVFWQEPYHGPLRKHHPKNFIMSPHVASTCSAFLEGLRGDLVELIKDLKK